MSEVRQTRNGCWMILNAAADAAAIFISLFIFQAGFCKQEKCRDELGG